MIYVIKFDGSRQPFEKTKVVRTCVNLGLSQSEAKQIADKVESELYDGISTKKILQLIFNYVKEYKPEIAHIIDLRDAISLLRPKPDFELFVQMLLREIGYDVIPNQIVRGACIEHEVDAIAKKNGKNIFVEIKHHIQPHTYTGVDVCLETQARLEDLKEGYKMGKTEINFDHALIVCNTKFSEHAKQYAAYKKIELLGWRCPENRGIEKIIEEKKFYPITLIKESEVFDGIVRGRLVDSGIILLKQLVKADLNELAKKTKIGIGRLEKIVHTAKEILGTS